MDNTKCIRGIEPKFEIKSYLGISGCFNVSKSEMIHSVEN